MASDLGLSTADDIYQMRGTMGMASASTILALLTAICGFCCTPSLRTGPVPRFLVLTAIAAAIAGAHDACPCKSPSGRPFCYKMEQCTGVMYDCCSWRHTRHSGTVRF